MKPKRLSEVTKVVIEINDKSVKKFITDSSANVFK